MFVQLVTMFVIIMQLVTIIFFQGYLADCQKNLCFTLFFPTDHLKYKTVNKTACRTPAGNPRQLCAHELESLRTVMIFFGFQNFLIYFGKVCLITVRFSLLDFSNISCKKQYKQNSLITVSLRYREIITVKTVTFCKVDFIFS